MLEWTPDYSTGVEEIDRQHQILFRFINNLEQEILKGETREVIEKAIEFMETYVNEHFAFEEMCMYGYSCPAAEPNKKAHQQFINRLKHLQLEANFNDPQTPSLRHIHQFCEQWLKAHILEIDQQLKNCRQTQHATKKM